MKTLIVAERKDGKLRRVTLELAAWAAGKGEVEVVELTGERFSPGAAAQALAARAEGAQLVLAGATAFGRDTGARLAAKLGRAYISEAMALDVADAVTAQRSAYAGKVRATVRAPLPAVVSVRPNTFPLPAGAKEPSVTAIAVGAEPGLTFERFEAIPDSGTGRVSLAEARVIVSAGRGLKAPENWKLVEELADVLGAATAASRAVTDAGWRPNEEQVGQTGKTVAPDLYIALGISGAIQHLAGMTSSKVIVAVNRDPDADIFKVCDYGIVGDLFEFVPRFTEAVKTVKAQG
ncbi:MAG: electron transfer flavoprotein subunit alpha/FixB family protein [Chloroflexi bacterium]|nr:electron transfer flavoprotein subunit alpha/FixB family protein [Chloroflexota bacterium]